MAEPSIAEEAELVPAVLDYLQGRGVTFQVIPHREAHTPVDEARALGIDPAEVVKTVVLVTRSGNAVAVVPASRRLDMRLVRAALADEHARLATEDELRRRFPEYEFGTLPPFMLLLEAPTYVDPAVVAREAVVFASGRRTQSIRIRAEDLFRDDPIVVTRLTHEAKDTEQIVVDVTDEAKDDVTEIA